MAQAQDERRVVSPNGQLQFRLFVSQPGSGGLPQLAYQVIHRGRTVIDTSFLGLHIHDQEPMLGENDGLIATHAGPSTGPYRSLIADYMQNGSIGRLIDIEVRVWDDAIAFRYLIPRSTALNEILIEEELTEFAIKGSGELSNLNLPAAIPEERGGWIGIAEVAKPGFPSMSLVREKDGVAAAHLTRATTSPLVAYEGKTPLTCPWRILTFASTKEQALHSPVNPQN
jgi:alpha-glucosidase